MAVAEDDRLRHLDKLSEILDSAFAIPGDTVSDRPRRPPSQILRLLLVPVILPVLALIGLPILALWLVFLTIF